MRIYSNYSDPDSALVLSEAEKLGFSPSAFQHYCVMLYVMQDPKNRRTATNLGQLTTKLLNNLNTFKAGDTFIVSALLPDEWTKLTRSDKMALAKALAKFVHTHPSEYQIDTMSLGKITRYKKIR